jgi:sterol 3beta-glucosyltransferase
VDLSIIAYGTWGDVYPSLALGLALKEAGYGVRLVVTEDFARWARSTGLDVHLLPVNKFEVMKTVSSRTNPLQVMLAIRREITPALQKAGKELLVAAENTDALLVNEWLLGIASGISEVFGLQLVHLASQPGIKTGVEPISTMPALPDWAPFRESYNRMSYDLARTLRWFTYASQINRVRKIQLKLAPLSFQGYLALLDRTPSITMISPQVLPRPADWPDRHRLTGFLFYDDEAWRPPAGLEDFIHSGEAPVYVGFGSMRDRQPEKTTRLVLEALEMAQQRGVLYRGWGDLGKHRLPDRVYRLDYAPHRWLFPRMAAVVHHAGAGTSAAALRAGVPSVPIPHSGDQLFWARRLHQIGGGTRPLPRSQINAAGLAERIAVAVRDSQLRRQAADLGDKIAGEDGAGRTVEAIREVLE